MSKRRKAMTVTRLAYAAYWRFVADDGWAIASHIALSGLMSLFPFMIFITSLAAFVGSSRLADEAAHLILDAWPEQVALPIASEIQKVLGEGRSDILTIGVVLSIYFSSNGVEALRVALNRAYGLKEMRPWWSTRLESIAYVLVGAVTLLAIAFLVVLAPVIWQTLTQYAVWLEPYGAIVTVARLVAATLIIVATLTIVHRWLPSGRRRIGEIMPGVLITCGLSILYASAFGWYLARMGQTYVKTYAGLASFMIALVFLYALAFNFIYGGEFNAAVMERRRQREAETLEATPEVEESLGPAEHPVGGGAGLPERSPTA
jgi:membrane protein